MSTYSKADLAHLSRLLSTMITDMLEAWFDLQPVQLSLLAPDPASPPAFSRPYGLCTACGQERVAPLMQTEPPPLFKRCRWGICQNQAMPGRRLCRAHYNQRQRHLKRFKRKAQVMAQEQPVPRFLRCYVAGCEQPVVPGLSRCQSHRQRGVGHAG